LLIPSGAQTRAGHEVRRSRSPRAAALCSRGNHSYSCLPSETGVQEARRSGAPGGRYTLFRGNHFPSFLPAETSQPRQPVDRRLWDTTLFSEGTTFPRSLYFTDAPCPAPRLPSPVLPLALHCCNEIAKLRQYGKRTRRCSDSFRQHPDAILTKIAEETAPLREVPNS